MNLPPEIGPLLESVAALQALARRAVEEYRPMVEALLRSDSRDTAQIEWTLDGLLNIAFDDEALVLFKRLCRHYLTIDPEATTFYVHAYREMWDEEEGE